MPKVSIITICYNEPDLEKICESIVNQTWQDFEWIVVDGGSNQETIDIFEKYKARIDEFISESDNGRYNAMNKGIKLSQGEYLNFLNAGDYYFYNDALKDVFENKKYNADVLYGNECFVRDNEYQNIIYPMPRKITKEYLFYSCLRHQASFLKRDIFNKYGLYNENNIVVSDYEKWLQLLENNATFLYLPYIISNFNLKGVSQTYKHQILANKERQRIINNYFSKDEINILKRKNVFSTKEKYSFIENIFSIKNSITQKHKIITIFGCHLKIKRGISGGLKK